MTRLVEPFSPHERSSVGDRAVMLWRAYRVIWPLPLLLAGEAAALIWLAFHGPLPLTGLSIAIGAGILLTGLLPALLRPDLTTSIFGGLATAMAGLMLLVPPGEVGSLNALAELSEPPPPGPTIFRLINGLLLLILALHLVMRFPWQRQVRGRTLLAGYSAAAFGLLAIALAPHSLARSVARAELALVTIGAAAICTWLLIRANQAPGTDERAAQQTRLVLISILIAEVPLALRPLLLLINLHVPYELILSSQIVLPVGIALAIMRDDLFEIDTAVRRALTYVSLSLLVLLIYLGVTMSLAVALVRLEPPLRMLAILAALLLAAVLFTPLRLGAELLIERVLYPERLVFRRELRDARAELSQVVRRDAVIHLLAAELPARLGASWAEVVLGAESRDLVGDRRLETGDKGSRGQGDKGTGAPSAGPMPEKRDLTGAWSAPLVVDGRVLGYFRLGQRRSGLSYASDEQEQLSALSIQAALALAYAEAFDALRALNLDLEERVAARTAQLLAQQRALITIEERQRLARDLHDSVKQTLFSLGLGLRAIRGMLRSDPEAAMAALREQEMMAVQAQAEMGALLAQLRAPAGTTIDLAPALSDHCAQLERQQGLQVHCELPESLVLPAAQAGELMQIARESLHNVLKHSGVKVADLTLRVEDAIITMTIRDRGRGFVPGVGATGMGLGGMRERALAAGGALEVRSEPGEGTVVRVRVPCA